MRRHFVDAEGPAVFRDSLRRRLIHLSEYKVAAGEVELAVVRLEWCFHELPLLIALGVVRFMSKSWCTTRRVSRAQGGYLFGCSAVGGDGLRHHLACPRMALAATQCGRRPPPWAGTGSLRIAALALPMSRPDLRSSAVWAFIAYRVHVVARLGGAPLSQIEFQRSPCARNVVFGLPHARRCRA